MALSVVCRQSLIDLAQARKNRQRYENLVYAFSVAVVVLSIVLVLTLVWGNNPSKALSGLAAIASGGGLGFVLNRRSEASTILTDAQANMRTSCGAPVGGDEKEAAGEADLSNDALDLIVAISDAS